MREEKGKKLLRFQSITFSQGMARISSTIRISKYFAGNKDGDPVLLNCPVEEKNILNTMKKELNSMVRKSEEKKGATANEESKDGFKTAADSYTTVTRIWEKSYRTLYKPWLESQEELFEKAAELSEEAAPQKYKEFYDEWAKTYRTSFGTFYPMPTVESTKGMFEKFIASAEASNRLYSSWIAELDENSRKTRELLQGKPDPVLYKNCNTMWMKSYGKIFDDLLALPATVGTKAIFENYTGLPDVYSENFVQISKLWKHSFAKLYEPWIESLSELSEKTEALSRGSATPEAYKEFYHLWLNTYQKTYGRVFDFQGIQPSTEVFEDFVQSTNLYLQVYRTWMTTLEKLVQKAKEITKQTTDPKGYKEFSDLWVKMYEKAFTSFFDDMPVAGPMKAMMDPVRIMAKIYSDTFAMMPKMSDFSSMRV